MISLKFALLRNGSRGLRIAGWIVGAALTAGTWVLVLLAQDEARHHVVTLAVAAWCAIAAVGPVLMSGAGILRPHYFALLPLHRGEIGRGLLLSVFVSVPSAYMLIALLVVTVPAAGDPASIAIAVLGAIVGWILAVTVSRLVYGLLGAAMLSRIGIEIAAIQFGLMFASMFTGWMIVQLAIQSVPQLLTTGLPEGPIPVVLDALPSSWPLLAAEAAQRGDGGIALAILAGLTGLAAGAVAATIPLLVPRSTARTARRRERRRSARLVDGGGILPATQLGAVIGKELRSWRRDAWRRIELRSGVWTGIAIAGFALASVLYSPLSPYAGLIVAFMLGIGACSVYSQDGTALWLELVGQDDTSVRSDVRGRQLAAVLVFAPHALLVSAIFVVLSGQYAAIPHILAGLPALLGAASGAAIAVAATGVSPGMDPRLRVGPNDAVGDMSLQVWIVMLLTVIGVLPTGAAVVWAALEQTALSAAVVILVGVANGLLAGWLYGGIAVLYLRRRLPELYSRIRYGRIFLGTAAGMLGWLEASTLKAEQQAARAKQKEREDRLARTRG